MNLLLLLSRHPCARPVPIQAGKAARGTLPPKVVNRSLLLLNLLFLLTSRLWAQNYTYQGQISSESFGLAQLRGPDKIAVDVHGNVYVNDADNFQVQKLTASGTFLSKIPLGTTGIATDTQGNVYVVSGNSQDSFSSDIRKFSASGALLSQFTNVSRTNVGIAVDASGNIYLAESNSDEAHIRRLSSSGSLLGIFGTKGTGDGQFSRPYGIGVDGNGNVYVTDIDNNCVQKFSSSGDFLAKFGSKGTGDGQFDHPYGIAVEPNGAFYVADAHNHRIQQFSSSGLFLGKFGSFGTGNGQFRFPHAIALTAGGQLYVGDTQNDRIQYFTTSGSFLGKFGGNRGNGQLYGASDVAIAPNGNIYVVEGINNRIQWFSPSGAFLGKFGSDGARDGQFQVPTDVAIDANGNVYVTDVYNFRVQKFSATGVFLDKFGDGQINSPTGIAVDMSGNVYIANQRSILKYSSSGTFLRRFNCAGADTQTCSFTDVTIDTDGNIYAAVADTYSNNIQKLNSSGDLLSQFGTTGSGDGQFLYPSSVAVDANGNIYVSDSQNHRLQKFNASGIFLTKFGSFGTGDGQFIGPGGLDIDASGNIYEADGYRIQIFAPTEVPLLNGFTLIDASTGKDIRPLQEGNVLNLLNLPDKLSVRANTIPTKVGSVVFDLNGQAPYRVENFAPYALASNNPDDSYVPYPFQDGNYVISATPYSQANRQGKKGLTSTVHFRVVRPLITGFTLINAATGGDIGTLHSGDVLDLATLPTHLSVRANTSPSKISSVSFGLSGLNGYKYYRTENVVPYALASNNPDDSYVPYPFQVGDYTLSATPYSQPEQGRTLTITFQVINSASMARTLAGEATSPLAVKVTAYPNPFGEKLYAVIKSPVKQEVSVHCYDMKGIEVGSGYQGQLEADQEQRIEIDGQALAEGLYLLRISTQHEQLVKKVMRQQK